MNNLKYKMIVSDYDDTAVGDDLIVSDRLKNAVKKYVSNGGIFTFATGRLLSAIITPARDMGLKGEIIAYQGGVIADIETGQIKYSQPIHFDVALEILKYIENYNVHVQIYHEDNFFVKHDSTYARMYERYADKPMIVTNENLSTYVFNQKINPTKILVMTDPAVAKNYLNDINAHFGKQVNINTSKPHLVEIVDKSVSKGRAVEKLAQMHNIPRENIICVGDALNDVSMINYAGLGVVVENGSPDAKQYAKFIAPSVKNDGLAYVIEKYGAMH